MTFKKGVSSRLALIFLMVSLVMFAAACTSSTTGNGDDQEMMDDEMDHDELAYCN